MEGQRNFNFYTICLALLLVYGPIDSNGTKLTNLFPPEMIAKEGYPVETHLVTTEDGYINTIHRIPGPPGSTPVFLQHGLCESSTDWLYNGKNGSLAYLLHQKGYDVWMGNARGNIYSTLHQNLSRSDDEYWDFSWDEQGMYDNPAAINYICNRTNQKLFYVGHSMGCTSFAVMASARPDVAQNVKAMFALAPAVFAYNNRQPLFVIASYFWKEILFFGKLLSVHQVLGRNWFWDFMADYACGIFLIHQAVCDNIILFIGGFDRPELPKDIAAPLASKVPAGTSLKVFIHYFQQQQLAKLRRFNYPSSKKNMEHYNSREPPEYDLTKIQVPVATFYSHNDWLVGAKDAERFYEQVPNKLGLFPVEPYDHFDFLIGIHAAERVYPHIFKLMSQFD